MIESVRKVEEKNAAKLAEAAAQETSGEEGATEEEAPAAE
jgi:hypothetical protein